MIFLSLLKKLKNKTIITNSYKKEFVDIFSIFNLYKNNKKFNQYFKSHDDLYSFINDQLQSISLKTNFNSLFKSY